MPAESVQCVVTSPPYWGLRDYGLEPLVWGGDADCEHEWGAEIPRTHEGGGNAGVPPEWQRPSRAAHTGGTSGSFCQLCGAWRGSLGLEPTPELYVAHLVEIFREVRRVLRKDGTVFLVLGDSYASNWPCNRRSTIGAGSLPDGRREVRPPRLGADLKDKDLVGIPWRVAFALQADGWWLRKDNIWFKTNPMPESVTDRTTSSHEYVFHLSRSADYYYDHVAIKEPPSDDSHGGGTDRYNEQLRGYTRHPQPAGADGRNKRSVWEIATEPYAAAHFATFPLKLVEPCILAGTSERGCCAECGAPWERVTETPKIPDEKRNRADDTKMAFHTRQLGGGQAIQDWRDANPTKTVGWQPTCDCNADTVPCTVLDIFGGSGATAVKALELGRHVILIELKAEYCEMAKRRIHSDPRSANLSIFNDPAL